MNKFFLLVFAVLVVFSCKEKSAPLVYSASCISKEGTEQKEFKLIFSDSTVVLLVPKNDPMIWRLSSKDGKMKTMINYQDLTINFSNKDSIVGNLYKETMKFDTTVSLDPATMVESMTIDTIMELEILNSCQFKKGKD